jgi:hypothetical protein
MRKEAIVLLVVMMLSIVVLVQGVTALEFDNVKSFNKNEGKYGTVTVTNLFGLGSDLVKIELQENTYFCTTSCYAEAEVILYDKGKLIDDLRFDKLRGNLTSYTVFIEDKGSWKEYDNSELEAGTYKVRIEGEKDFFGKVDWIGTWAGIEVEEWALWDIGVVAYYDLDEGTGTSCCF